MLIEKEVIRDGTYWYLDQKTGEPKKLVVTPELRKYWYDQGSAMLSAGMPIPVPYEHDFSMHPMTPKELLINNAGEVKEFKNDNNKLVSVVEVQDPKIKDKIGKSVRWTSPWFNSFTDGDGRKWNNVITHLALTTRPRVTRQEPFGSISAALSIASEVKVDSAESLDTGADGYCLSRAGLLVNTGTDSDIKLQPRYPLAFSLWGGGIKLSDGDIPTKKTKKQPPKSDDKVPPNKEGGSNKTDNTSAENTSIENEDDTDDDDDIDPLTNMGGDVSMEELLCDLLQALGVPMPDESSPAEFKRHLYEATMCKIKDLASKGDPNSPQNTAKTKVPQPGQNIQNPLIKQVQQEQQPMYMSLEEINKLPDPMKGVALAMYAENQKLRTELDSNKKVTDSLRDAKLKEASVTRSSRIALLSKLSPRVKSDLDTMLAMPSMALSMGDGGSVIDPMEQTLSILEKSLGDLPRMLIADQSALSITPHPKDEDELTNERANEIADGLSRQMGWMPQNKAS